ncbi:MAG: gliding motility-associated C-terminal domain-containing protein [Prolixibacteraceae bacterium]|nr:gliding motility-associated C-terminal domain-containing protein [Prolixibacteraceae bacterium]
MKRVFFFRTVLIFFVIIFASSSLVAQLSAPGAEFTDETNYPVFGETDSIYIFCSIEEFNFGKLVAETNLTGTKSFLWEKYNPVAFDFDPYFSEDSENNYSQITELADGCYRVTITKEDTIEIYRAWVLNDWFTATGRVSDSDCDYFKLRGEFTTAGLKYYDLADNTEIEVFKDVQVEWRKSFDVVARVSNPSIYDPPTSDTDYKFVVSDRFGCSGETNVTYISVVTKAEFTIEADFNSGDQQGEAPMEVTFINDSENGTPGEYEWFFFRDLDQIKKESETSSEPVDSFMFVAYDDDLIYTYEKTGTYMVKLVSKKISDYHILNDSMFEGVCTDTFYLEDYIITDTSYFDVPNVFTPNNDGTNDNFVVKFWSMDKAKITIVNRWGRTVHFWEKSNIQRFEGTWAESVWDGKIGGRYASPGVYYYVAEGKGRDGKNRWARGFFHLFRGKD